MVALLVAAKDLRQRLRDRSALMIVFVAPAVITAILSLALSGTDDFHVGVVIHDGDRGPTGAAITSLFASPGLDEVFTVTEAESAAQARARVSDDHADVAVLLPAGLSSAPAPGDGASAEIGVLAEPSDPISAGIVRSVVEEFAGVVRSGPPAVRLDDRAVRAPAEQAASYYGPSMGVFFLFLTVQIGAGSIIAERRSGTLARLLTSPVRFRSVVVGKVLATFALGLLGMTALYAFSRSLLGAQWGDPLPVAALIVATVVAGVGVTALVTALARSQQDADGISGAIAIVLALLGGNFIPLSQAPDVLRRLRVLTPHGWALDGFVDTGFADAGLADILPNITAVLAFGLIAGVLATLAMRRRLEFS